MGNKVKYNIKNCHYAKLTLVDGEATFGTPVAMPGAVSLSLEANGEPEPFYADGIEYYVANNNQGYDGDFEVALIPEGFRKDCLAEILDDNGVLIENANAELEHFALLFEFDGDKKAIRHALLNCTAGRPTIEGQTNEDKKEVQPEKLTIKAAPLPNGYVKAKTGDTTGNTAYNGWYNAVYVPTVTMSVTPATLSIAASASGTVAVKNAKGTVTASVQKGGTTSTDLTVTISGDTATIAAGSGATGTYTVTFSDAGTTPATTKTVTVTISE